MVNAINGDFARNRRHHCDRRCSWFRVCSVLQPLGRVLTSVNRDWIIQLQTEWGTELILCQAGSGQAGCTCSSAFTDTSLWLPGEVEQLLQGNVVLGLINPQLSAHRPVQKHTHTTPLPMHTHPFLLLSNPVWSVLSLCCRNPLSAHYSR